MNFNFGEILTKAWQIIWKHKILWVFGVFAGCSRGGGGSGGGGGGGGGNYPGGSSFERSMEQFGQWIGDNLWVIIFLVFVALIIIVLSIYLGTIGRIALIKGTYKAEQGADQLVFGELFSESGPYFWRIFGLSLIVGLVFLVILLPVLGIGALTAGIGLACLAPLFCLLVPVGLVVGVIIEQANAAIVLEDLSISEGWQRGWNIVKSNIGPVLLMAIMLAVIGFVIGLVIAIPIIIAVFPLIFSFASGDTGPIWIAVACCAVYFPILLVLNGILTSYIQSAWTLTYMQLTKPLDNAPVVLETNA